MIARVLRWWRLRGTETWVRTPRYLDFFGQEHPSLWLRVR